LTIFMRESMSIVLWKSKLESFRPLFPRLEVFKKQEKTSSTFSTPVTCTFYFTFKSLWYKTTTLWYNTSTNIISFNIHMRDKKTTNTHSSRCTPNINHTPGLPSGGCSLS
jgi:hypothetical protein